MNYADAFIVWFISFYIPVLSVLFLVRFGSAFKTGSMRRSVLVHGFIMLSIVLSLMFLYQYSLFLPMNMESLYIFLFCVCLISSMFLLGVFGLIYALSVIIQEACLLTMAYFLFHAVPLVLVLLMIAPLFTLAHAIQPKHWKVKLSLSLLWGVTTIIIFYILHNLLINISLHLIIGSLLVYKKVLYPETDFTIKNREI